MLRVCEEGLTMPAIPADGMLAMLPVDKAN